MQQLTPTQIERKRFRRYCVKQLVAERSRKLFWDLAEGRITSEEFDREMEELKDMTAEKPEGRLF